MFTDGTVAGGACNAYGNCTGLDLVCNDGSKCECDKLYANKTGNCVDNPLTSKYILDTF